MRTLAIMVEVNRLWTLFHRWSGFAEEGRLPLKWTQRLLHPESRAVRTLPGRPNRRSLGERAIAIQQYWEVNDTRKILFEAQQAPKHNISDIYFHSPFSSFLPRADLWRFLAFLCNRTVLARTPNYCTKIMSYSA